MTVKPGTKPRYLRRFLKDVLRVDKLSFFFSAIVGIVLAVATVGTTYLPKFFIDGISTHDLTLAVSAIATFFALIVIFNTVGQLIAIPMEDRKLGRIHHFVRTLFAHTFSVRQQHLEERRFYNDYSMREANLEKAASSIVGSFGLLFNQGTTVIAIIGLLSSINILFAFFTLVPIALDIWLSIRVNNLNIEEQKAKRDTDRKMQILGRIFYQYNSLRDIKMYDAVEPVMNRLYTTMETRRRIHKKYYTKASGLQLVGGILTESAPIVSMVLFGYFVYRGDITVSEYFVFVALYEQLKQSLTALLAFIPSLNNIQLWVSDYYQYLDNKAICEPEPTLGEPLTHFTSIEFRHVSFRYENAEDYALQDVSFNLNRSETTMIIGLNGSGKSTLMKLLCGVYTPTEGEIFINGKRLSDYKTQDVRRLFAVLFQDYYMFPFSIRDNMTMFDSDGQTETDAKTLIERFELKNRIEALKSGYETGIKGEYCDDYTDLSGGELQKLAIIRAFCKHSSELLLLDEPLNNVDLKSENSFYDLVLNDKRTVILISHSLKIAPHVKTILYMKNGRLIANGSHEALLKNNASYKLFYDEYIKKYFKTGEDKSVAAKEAGDV